MHTWTSCEPEVCTARLEYQRTTSCVSVEPTGSAVGIIVSSFTDLRALSVDTQIHTTALVNITSHECPTNDMEARVVGDHT